MLNRFILVTAALMTANVVQVAQAATYTIDPAHTSANFAIDHMGTSTNRGNFSSLTGTVDYNPTAKTGSVDITIPINSLQTNFPKLAEDILTEKFFNPEQYPTARFQSTKWYFKGNKPSKIVGNLTLLGQTHPVTLTATKFNCYNSPINKAETCGGDFETTIDRTNWGMNAATNLPSMKMVKLNIQVEAKKQ